MHIYAYVCKVDMAWVPSIMRRPGPADWPRGWPRLAEAGRGWPRLAEAPGSLRRALALRHGQRRASWLRAEAACFH